MNRKAVHGDKTTKMAAAGLFAAMITVMTAYICHIPYGVNGGYIHFGDALIYLAAVFLPRPYALAAAAIGGGAADLLTAPVWAPATVIIKMLIVLLFSANGEGSLRQGIGPRLLLPRRCLRRDIMWLRECCLGRLFLRRFLCREALSSPAAAQYFLSLWELRLTGRM